MFYYLLDKDNTGRIREASENKDEIISLLSWMPEYTEKDILSTEDTLYPTPENGWVTETEAKHIAEIEAESQSNDVDEENQKLNKFMDDVKSYINDIRYSSNSKNQTEEEKRYLESKLENSEPLSYHDLRDLYVNKITELIKDAASDVIYGKYPVYKQLNISMLGDDSQDKKDFASYRDSVVKQCDEFIEDLENSFETEEKMTNILDDLLINPFHHQHAQSILEELGFNKYVFNY